jgi:hypothetical protein
MWTKYLQNVRDQKIKTDPSFFLFIPWCILPPEEHKVNKELVLFRNNQRNSRPFLTLKVAHNSYITKETFCVEGVNKVVTAHRLQYQAIL